jgi:hypothetical protein
MLGFRFASMQCLQTLELNEGLASVENKESDRR